MTNDQLTNYIKDRRDRGFTNEQIIAELVQAGWLEKEARNNVLNLQTNKTVMQKRHSQIWLILVVLIVIAIGIGVWVMLSQKDKNKINNNQPVNQSVNQSVSDDVANCKNLPQEKHFVTLDILKKDVKFSNVTSGNVTRNLSDLDKASIDKLLAAVQPYIRAITGYEYTNVETSLSPSFDNQNKVQVYVRASTGKKDIEKYIDEFMGSGDSVHDFFYDFKSSGYDDHAYYVEFDISNGTVGQITPTYFVGWDVPDTLADCSLALLEKDEALNVFKQKHDKTKTGLLGWQIADPTKGIEEDSITAMIHTEIPNERGCHSYDAAYFSINPWKGTVKLEKEEQQTLCAD